jgi:hypothetical protein
MRIYGQAISATLLPWLERPFENRRQFHRRHSAISRVLQGPGLLPIRSERYRLVSTEWP